MIKFNISRNVTYTIQSLDANAMSAVLVQVATREWFHISVGVRQGCMLSPTLFITFLEYIRTHSLENYNSTVSIGGRKITNLRFCRWHWWYHRNENARVESRKDRIKNETIRAIAKVTPIKSVLTHKRLSWYWHVMRREETHITSSALSMTVTGTRPRGRPRWDGLTDWKWHAHLWYQPRNGHWQRTLGCHGEKRRHYLDGRRRKRLVTVSIDGITEEEDELTKLV